MQKKDYVTPPMPSGMKVKWAGLFNASAVYQRMKYWLDFNGYGSNFKEEEYYELVKGDSKTIGARWYAEKKVSGYFGYVIEANIFITGMKEVTAKKNGYDITLNKGNFEVKMAAYVVRDINDKYKNEFAQNFYEKVVIKNRVDEAKADLSGKIYDFQEEIKKALSMP